jgi:hypothetical protein
VCSSDLDLGAIPLLRATLEADPAPKVREACVVALARLGDLEIADWLLSQLVGGDEVSTRAAVLGAGALLDRRAVGLLWDLMAAGKHPQLVPEALAAFGDDAREAGLTRLRAEPELGKRAGARAVIVGHDPAEATRRALALLADATEAAALGDAALHLVWDLDPPRPGLVDSVLRRAQPRPRVVVARRLLELVAEGTPLFRRASRVVKEPVS